MKLVFADTGYFVAQLNPRDDHHASAIECTRSLGPHRLCTSEMIFAELLNFFAEKGPALRSAAADLCERLRENPNVDVVPQTRDLFLKALEKYRTMADKGWSVTDCASFHLMESRGIRDALTHDHHFEQAGFRALMRGR